LGESGALTRYIVRRFRRNVNTDGWDFKGATDAGLCTHVKVRGLQNGCHYTFSVLAVSKRGAGVESNRSAVVVVDKPLPKGWRVHFDPQSGRSLYQHEDTQLVTWERPVGLDTTLDAALYLKLRAEEHKAVETFFERVSELASK
jgi:hypothetical protein